MCSLMTPHPATHPARGARKLRLAPGYPERRRPISPALAADPRSVPGDSEASLREEPIFYGTYALVVGVGALVVLVPGAPLVTILFITQAINAVLLLPLLAFIALPRAIVRSWASTQPVGRGRLRSWR